MKDEIFARHEHHPCRFIWKSADDLWGNFKHVEFGNIILPFTLLRRLECVLEPTREQVRQTVANLKNSGIDIDVVLRTQAGHPFYNTSNYELRSLGATRTRQNLEDYIASYSENAGVIFEQFDFSNTITRMDRRKEARRKKNKVDTQGPLQKLLFDGQPLRQVKGRDPAPDSVASARNSGRDCDPKTGWYGPRAAAGDGPRRGGPRYQPSNLQRAGADGAFRTSRPAAPGRPRSTRSRAARQGIAG